MSEQIQRPEVLLERFRHLLGNKPDGEIASLAGVQRNTVMAFRRRLQIPAYVGHRFKPGEGGEGVIDEAMPDLSETTSLQPADDRVGAPVVSPDAPAAVEAPAVAPVAPPRKAGRRVGVVVNAGFAYRVVAEVDGQEQEYLVAGTDIVQVARRVVDGLSARHVPFRVIRVQFLAQALLG